MLPRLLFFAAAAAATGFAVPAITQQPQAVAVRAGQPATFSVAATGTGNLTYQWRRDGFALAGATSAAFAIASSSQADNGSYDVVVTDSQQAVASGLALLRVSPRISPDLIVVDPAKAARLEGPEIGDFQDMAFLPDGRSYVAGGFTRIEDQTREGLARLTATGALDSSFAPAAIDGPVEVLATQPDGKLLVAGFFANVGGQPSGSLARLNLDGSLDATFGVGTGFAGRQRPIFRAVAVAPDGSALVSGQFPNGYQGRAVGTVVKLSAQAALVENFSVPANLSDGPTSFVFNANGSFYASGVALRNADASSSRYGIARFLASGAIDPTFPHVTTDQFNPVPLRVLRIADGSLIAYGGFTQIGGVNRTGFARILESGAVDPALAYSVPGGSYIGRVAAFPNGDLLVCGSLFGRSVARLRLGGALDITFSAPNYSSVNYVHVFPDGRSLIAGGGMLSNANLNRAGVEILRADGLRASGTGSILFPARVNFMRQIGGGKIIVAGDFTHWNGEAVGQIVRLNADFSLDRTFRIGAGTDGRVSTGTVQPDGKIVTFGRFSRLVGFTANAAARLNADGTFDTSFNASAPLSSLYMTPPAVLRDGKLFVPALFSAPRSFFVFGPNGTVPANDGFGLGANSGSSITAAALLPNGQLLVGGRFTAWNGQDRPYLVRLNAGGTLDSSLRLDPALGQPIEGFDVNGVSAQSTGRMIVRALTTPVLRRLDASGNLDPQFTAALPSLGFVAGLLILPDDRLLIWGYDNPGNSYLVRLNPNGSADASLVVVGRGGRLGDFGSDAPALVVTDAGEIVSARDGELAVYTPSAVPIITRQPLSATMVANGNGSLTVGAVGSGTLAYQWTFNGQPIAGATAASLTLQAVTPSAAGIYRVNVTDSRGSATSAAATLTVDTSANRSMRLGNVSVRARVAGQPMIVGFVVNDGTKQLLVRGIGPALAQFGVAGALPNPRVNIYRDAALVDQNDNWGGDHAVAQAASAVSAFPLAASSLDAALLRSFAGAQTVHVDAATGSGVALAEIYDTAPVFGGAPRIANVSARHQVGTAENILIAGFSLVGTGNKALLIRGIGPALGLFGVSGALADPQLAIFAGASRIAENNDWGGTFALSEAFTSVGAFPLGANSRDAAVVVYLPAGSYTAQLSGVGGTTGEGLIEIYELP